MVHCYGANRLTTITGPRGTALSAHTSEFHAGPVPVSKPRLMFEIGYSLLPIFALRYNPPKHANFQRHNKYMNRLLIRSA